MDVEKIVKSTSMLMRFGLNETEEPQMMSEKPTKTMRFDALPSSEAQSPD